MAGGTITDGDREKNRSSLFINYSTSAVGHVKVALLDEKGSLLLESAAIYGDEIFEKVNFGISLNQFGGRHIRLAFDLKDADIYAIKFGE